MIRISVPASSANMGPGFDCMGIALSMENLFDFQRADRLSIRITGQGGRNIPADERNLVYRCFAETLNRLGTSPFPVELTQKNVVPSARGLGSSSTAIVAAILAADHFAGAGLSKSQMLDLAVDYEGHPDNVAPALLGGMTVSFVDEGGHTRTMRTEVGTELVFLAMIPSFELATKKARAVLPSCVPLEDAVYNLSRGVYLAAAFAKGEIREGLRAMEDRLHQTQRSRLIPGYADIVQEARRAGAAGCYLSGAGPTIMAVVERDRLHGVQSAMGRVLSRREKRWKMVPLSAQNSGATLLEIPGEKGC